MKALHVCLYLWLFFAGIFYGLSINAAAERCGHPVTLEDSPLDWLAWPIVVVAALVIDESVVAYSSCAAMRGDGGVR